MSPVSSVKRDSAPYRRRVGLGGGTGLRKTPAVRSTPHFQEKKEESTSHTSTSKPHFSGGSYTIERK